MSMIGNLAVLPQEQLNKLLKQPAYIEELLYPSRMPAPKRGFFKRLFGGPIIEEQTGPIEPLQSFQRFDVDKAWHALHFLFTGTAEDSEFPAGFLCSGGDTVGNVDVGYGPANYFHSDQVAKISDFLQSLDDRELRKKFDPKVMRENDIYSFWEDSDINEEWDYLHHNLDGLRSFLLDAKAKRMALLVYIN